MAYSPTEIEPKWQAHWLANETFRSEINQSKPKYYVLDMFPYPSGDGLHVGHALQMTATDILARYKRMLGFNVLHPMGWDAFGLPAEQYAIKTGTHPEVTTRQNIDNFRRQIRSLGCSYDWSREVNTTDPGYVKWTQWIFRKIHERGLAYEAEVPVNWCPELGTVLSNEEVIDGKSEIGGHPVVRVPLKQWMLRITRYADRLLEDLEDLDWPEPIKKMQRDWIGRSEGARVVFSIQDMSDAELGIFTTRPDTLFGATYMVLAPEHPLVDRITSDSQQDQITAYVEKTRRRSERDRIADLTEKSGVFTGAYAVNPVNDQAIPIWIADYVLASYGTGAIMAVPGHDERDHAFAKKFNLPIVEVVAGGQVEDTAFVGEGLSVNSDFLNGLKTPEAKKKMNAWLEQKGVGEATVTYKLRDWLFSRQRYWGEPFPVIHSSDGTTKLVPEEDLPITLPELEDFRPTGDDFEAPLARIPEWLQVSDPETGAPARRDPNTMPQWAGSCWYYLRFVDPHNSNAPWSEEAEQSWMPVDLYMGGAEHAVLHLLYSRFWHKVLYDIGLVHTREPFEKLVNQGMILGESFRYYDDHIDDQVGENRRVYSSEEVEAGPGGMIAREDGRPVKARWLNTQDLIIDPQNGEPRHPEYPELVLEKVLEKMSKSRGNVVNPDDVIASFGADSMRLYEMFIGPLEKDAPWSTDGLQGIYRFLQRCWRLVIEETPEGEKLRELRDTCSPTQARLLARTIKGVTDDIEGMRFNTAISKLMVLVRDISSEDVLAREAAEKLCLMLAPMAPHLAEELWQKLGHEESLTYEPWPKADADLLEEEEITIVVQVNGKKRDELRASPDSTEEQIQEMALASEKVQASLAGRSPKKIIVVPGRLANVVV